MKTLRLDSERWALGLLLVAWGLILLLPDLTVRGEGFGWLYVLTAATSLLTWCLAAALVGAARRGGRAFGALLAAVLGASLTALPLATLGYHRFYRRDPPSLEWQFFLENPAWAFRLMADAVTGLQCWLLGLASLLLAVVLYRAGRHLGRRRRTGGLAVVVVPASLLTYFGDSLPADLTGLRAVAFGTYGHLMVGGEPRTLPAPARLRLQPFQPRAAPNVLLIIHESLGAAQTVGPGAHAPALNAFIARRPRVVSFDRASAIATATCVSVPALLTGLSPQAPRAHFARAPLAWQVAQAAGYRTGLFSAQDFSIDFFQSFFLGADRPDVTMTAPDYQQPPRRVNELGVADSLAVDAAVRFIETPGRPFFTVVQLNGTHWPCWSPELGRGVWRTQHQHLGRPDAARCAVATRYVDAQVDRLFQALEDGAALENTLVIVTSDHGEVWRPERPMRRYSFLEDVLAIPLIIHLPVQLADALPVLQANSRARANHLDLLPTLLDAWGAWPPPDPNWPELSGQSLLRPLPPRHLVSVTDSSISQEPPGFAVFADRWKWIAQPGRLHLFDLTADPGERQDVAARAPEPAVRALAETVATHAFLGGMLKQLGLPAPDSADAAEPTVNQLSVRLRADP